LTTTLDCSGSFVFVEQEINAKPIITKANKRFFEIISLKKIEDPINNQK
jgi:hypothetical protein